MAPPSAQVGLGSADQAQVFLLSGEVVYSASDLTLGATCEYALLRSLDYKLKRVEDARLSDAMLDRTATLGNAHEEAWLEGYRKEFGPWDPQTGHGVYEVTRPEAKVYQDRGVLGAKHAETLDALRAGADVVFQGGFFDGRFHGWSDFLVKEDDAYTVYDTKLARHAKVTAVLQLAAYGDQLLRAGIPVASSVRLILGDHSKTDHSLRDVLPVYRHRRARVEAILDAHVAADAPARWDDGAHRACGRCGECAAQVEATRDLLLVAGLSTVQRTRLHAAGITTIDELAASEAPVPRVGATTLERLRAQAALQVSHDDPTTATVDGGRPVVRFDLYEPQAIGHLPPPDAGDLFFDFEGDPLWNDGDLSNWGLEYLFGWVEAPDAVQVQGRYTPLWAHDRAGEKAALERFVDHLVARRAAHPGMHVYHYAAYETAALKRLVGRHGTRETELDALLTAGVFVDLYTTVRESLRVSQPSYSLKKLEPLYMGAQLREGVDNAADSIVAYAQACEARDRGQHVEHNAALDDIAQYNAYDCESTYRLRQWLVERGAERGVTPAGAPRPERSPRVRTPRQSDADDAKRHAAERADAAAAELWDFAERASSDQEADGTAAALLAAAVGYHRREEKPYWWAHFGRLSTPVEDWTDTRGTFRAADTDAVEVLTEWECPSTRNAWRRTVRLRGELEPGTDITPSATVLPYYRPPLPEVANAGADCPNGWNPSGAEVLEITTDGELDVVTISESAGKAGPTFEELPYALGPASTAQNGPLVKAIAQVAVGAAASLPRIASSAVVDILRRHPPRLKGGRALADLHLDRDRPIEAITQALLAMDDSYLAVQGPPGTGKTYTAAHVIAGLVRDHGWRIGVTAQSHEVVENVLRGVRGVRGVRACGVPADAVGKKLGRHDQGLDWTVLWPGSDKVPGYPDAPSFAAFHAAQKGGYVVGGTAWDFVSEARLPDEPYDLLVVDEAGQFCLANTVAVSASAHRILLLGDPQQLPQVSQGTHPAEVDRSALGWLADGARTLPDELGLFLAASRRLHPDLCAAVSDLAYDGRLHSQPVAATRKLEGVRPGLHPIPVAHDGNKTESPQEAAAVVDVVADLVGRRWQDPDRGVDRPFTPSDAIVVAAYNAQVGTIRTHLDAAGFTTTRVGTVDKFQGQEAAVVIVSLAASSADEVPRGVGFLLNRNRLNVAISRGQVCAYLVHSPRLLDHLPASPAALEEFGAFVALAR